MTQPLWTKLNLTTQSVVHVLDAPASFEPELAALGEVTVQRAVRGRVTFALAFVVTQQALDARSAALVRAAEGDAILWMIYPKGTSKRYRAEFNRDSSWQVLRDAGFETVRMVAIDADWSALRFRRVEFSAPSRRARS